MTLQQLGEKATELMMSTVPGNNGGETATTPTSICLSMMSTTTTTTTTDTTQNNNRSMMEEIEWRNNQALVRDIVPKMSLVYCTKHSSCRNSNNNNTNSPPENMNEIDLTSERHSLRSNNKENTKREVVDLFSLECDNNIGSPSKKRAKKSSTIAKDQEVIDLCSLDCVDDSGVAVKSSSKKQPLIADKFVSSAAEAAMANPLNPSMSFASSSSSSPPSLQVLDDPRSPSKVTTPGEFWLWQAGPSPYSEERVLGKWLLFRNADIIDEEWMKIAAAVKSGKLHAAQSKVSTQYNTSTNPNSQSKSSHVICIYTSESRMMEVGMALIKIVEHDIRYKTDEATVSGEYGAGATCQMIYWNFGNPSTKRLLWTKTESSQRARTASASNNKMKQRNQENMSIADETTTTNSTDIMKHPFHDIKLTVTGLQHGYYKSKQGRSTEPLGGKVVALIREPNNSYDKSAIRVELEETKPTMMATTAADATKVGYIQKNQAGVLAPWMDRNLLFIEHATMHMIEQQQKFTNGRDESRNSSTIVVLHGKASHRHAIEMLHSLSVAAS